jgi:hypothetical protein
MLFLTYQNDRSATRNPERTATFVVDWDAFLTVGNVADLQARVGATDNVNEKGICWRRCNWVRAHSMRFAYSGHSTRPGCGLP